MTKVWIKHSSIKHFKKNIKKIKKILKILKKEKHLLFNA